MARSRGHSKSASTSSAIGTPAGTIGRNASSPVATRKSPTPVARKPRRTSAASPPTSPVSATRPAPKRASTSSLLMTFPLVVALSALASTALFAAIGHFTAGDLAAISKRTESWIDIGLFFGWKTVELGVYWFGGFDAYDVASLSILSTTPTALLLSLFYTISPTTVTLNTLAKTISSTIPFLLFRSLSPPHHPTTASRTSVRNKSILTDPFTVLSTSLLATVFHAVALQTALVTYLSTFFITHFTGIRSLSFAHAGVSSQITLLLALIPTGAACTAFLFLPPAGIVKSYLQAGTFNPVTAGLGEHIYHNLWGWYSSRQRELVLRTVVGGVLVLAGTVVECWATIEGVELLGALGYAGVFAGALGAVGMVYEWVGGPSG